MGRRRGGSAERDARVALRSLIRLSLWERPAKPGEGQRLTRGIFVVVLLAIAISALVVAWGDTPAGPAPPGGSPPLLIVPVVLLTVWNYSLRWLRWNYYLRVLGVV